VEEFLRQARPQIDEELRNIRRYLSAGADAPTNREVRREIQDRMSECASVVRRPDAVQDALRNARAQLRRVQKKGIRLSEKKHLNVAFQNEHLCLTHVAFLETIAAYIRRGGGSRGGYMVADEEGELTIDSERGEDCPHRAENRDMRGEILETVLCGDGQFEVYPVDVRPLPKDNSWYETVWRDWREGRV
jgi:succinate dehydrogenase/fumarate reductase flavoprotein subunit